MGFNSQGINKNMKKRIIHLFFLLVYPLYAFVAKGDEQLLNEKSVTRNNIKVTLSLKKSKLIVSKLIYLEVEILNNSKHDIFINDGSIFDFIEMSVIEESITTSRITTLYEVKGKIVKNPNNFPQKDVKKIKKRNPLRQIVKLTLYGKSIKSQHKQKREKLGPGQNFFCKVGLTRYFDFSTVANYHILSKLKYSVSKEKEKNNYQFFDLPELLIKMRD